MTERFVGPEAIAVTGRRLLRAAGLAAAVISAAALAPAANPDSSPAPPAGDSATTAQTLLVIEPTPEQPRNSEGDLLELRDGSLALVYTRFKGGDEDHSEAELAMRTSADGGKTWSGDRVVVPNEGGRNVMSVSLLRSATDEVLLFYLRKDTQGGACNLFVRRSSDELKTLSDPVRVTTLEGYHVVNNARVVRLSSGRIIVPTALHAFRDEGATTDSLYSPAAMPMAYFSDDDGKTWKRDKSPLIRHPEKGPHFQEPGIVELRDGRLWMYIRTNRGSQFGSYSSDNGETWTAPAPTALRSPLSPATIQRVPGSGELMAVWNDHSGAHPFRKGKRTPLAFAFSRDEGRTWGPSHLIENNPDGWYCYTSLLFQEGRALLSYCAGDSKVGGLNRLKVTALPLATRAPTTSGATESSTTATGTAPPNAAALTTDTATTDRDPRQTETSITVAAYYYPCTHPHPRWDKAKYPGFTEWDLVRKAKPRFPGHRQPKVPVWGYQDESDPAAMARKIDAAADHGVDAFIFDWYYYDDGPYLERALDQGFLQAANNSRIRFGLMWANHDWFDIQGYNPADPVKLLYPGKVTPATWDKITDLVISRYFRHPSYWMVDGKPYFSIYEMSLFLDSFGSVEASRAALDRFREKARAAGFPGLHINAILWGQPNLPGGKTPADWPDLSRRLALDSVTGYTWVHHGALNYSTFPVSDYVAGRDTYFKYWEKALTELPVPYFPNATINWDNSPRAHPDAGWKNPAPHVVNPVMTGNTPSAFAEACRMIRNRLQAAPTQPKIVTVNAWNEWPEGSVLEPEQEHGYGYLQALRSVFGTDAPETSGTAETKESAEAQ